MKVASRNLIHHKFTTEELQTASGPEGGRAVEGSSDLTLGSYCRLLQNNDNWDKLGLQIDRSLFTKHLEEVRKIRNDVMHFNLDGLDDDQTKELQDLARFFENLVRLGAM